jgi:aminoglycoside 6'-N-acetyltransferase
MFDRFPVVSGAIALRKLRMGDLVAFHEYRSDADVARFQGWSPMSMQQAAEFLASQAGQAQLVPGAWHQIAIALAAGDALVGDMGVWISEDQRQAELGLSIHPRHQGEGHGTAAIRALIALLFSATPVIEVVASSDVRNVACLALLARSGIRCIATSTPEYKAELCTERHFSITRDSATSVA